MSRVSVSSMDDKRTWSRAAMIVIRLALLVFLVWVLVSARLPEITPVAEDSPEPSQHSHSVAEPCSAPDHQLG